MALTEADPNKCVLRTAACLGGEEISSQQELFTKFTDSWLFSAKNSIWALITSNMRRLTDEPVLSFLQVRCARLAAARERLIPKYFDGAQTYGSDIKSTTEKAAQLPNPCTCVHKPPVEQRTTLQNTTNQTSCRPSISRNRRF